jgi:uncharacterized C2H2 Zn-finger protein
LSKINPGSNIYSDNDVRTARPGGLQGTDFAEPTIDDDGKLHCPKCSRVFISREDYISHALSKHQFQKQDIDRARAILAQVSYDHGFHFFTDIGRYTGETATSLATFARDVEVAPIESIDFHFKRGDFQKWIGGTIGDSQLAASIEHIDKELAGEPLRIELRNTINARVTELENRIQLASNPTETK